MINNWNSVFSRAITNLLLTNNSKFVIFIVGQIWLLLHACKKQKEGAQKRDLDIALNRMKEVL
jgi:hypothetical protein